MLNISYDAPSTYMLKLTISAVMDKSWVYLPLTSSELPDEYRNMISGV